MFFRANWRQGHLKQRGARHRQPLTPHQNPRRQRPHQVEKLLLLMTLEMRQKMSIFKEYFQEKFSNTATTDSELTAIVGVEYVMMETDVTDESYGLTNRILPSRCRMEI